MSSFRLLGLAAEAESLRLGAHMRGMAWHAEFIGAAALAAAACLVMVHIGIWHALVPGVAPHWAGLIMATCDAALAVVLLLVARLRPSRAEELEAARLRDLALRGAVRGGPVVSAIADLALSQRGGTMALAQMALAAFNAAKR